MTTKRKVSGTERYEQIMLLRGEGRSYKEIAKILGLSYSTVNNVINDPNGSKRAKRQKRYAGTCQVCGASTTGSNGRAKAPKICKRCAAQRQHDNRYWTKERIVAAIRAFVAETGKRPYAKDWLRHPPPGMPFVSTIMKECGSWNQALRLAGVEPLRPGEKPRAGHRAWTTEELLAELLRLSPNGVAPSTSRRPGCNICSMLRARGYLWQQACAKVGVRPRGDAYIYGVRWRY